LPAIAEYVNRIGQNLVRNSVAKVFETHPPTDDRIKAAEEEIQTLKARPAYIVNTSEFNDVKARL